MNSTILVIGSLNMDLVVLTQRMPLPGETIAGEGFHMIPGGKGANQAVAASRAGAKTSIIGCVGNDAFGKVLLDSLKNARVNVSGVSCVDSIPTGTATIIVEANGKNRIIIIPGANYEVTTGFIAQVWDVIDKAEMVLLQHEIPMATIHEIIEHCHQQKVKVLLNLAPMYPMPEEILSLVDTLVLNETEAAALTGMEIRGEGQAIQAARQIVKIGVKTVIITLGELGAVLMNKDESIFQPALRVQAIDTTAAGDTFVGSYTASMLAGKTLSEALLYASVASAIAVTRLGAQSSIPNDEEIVKFIETLNLQKIIPKATFQKEV